MTNKQKITVYAPATIGNLGPGFDVLGAAIAAPGDAVTVEKQIEKGVSFTLDCPRNEVPADHNNVVVHVAQTMLDQLQLDFGVKLTLHKRMPISSGLGSSGASAAATAVAINQLLEAPLNHQQLIEYAMLGEHFVSGGQHADNVAPCILGGICLVRSYQPLDIIQVKFANVFHWVVVHPHLKIETKQARNKLPNAIPLSVTVNQLGHVAAVIDGLSKGDIHLLGRALNDFIAEPVRAEMIQGYAAVKQAALDAGAAGFNISGSGPSVFAVAASESQAQKVAKAIEAAFMQHAKVACDSYISKINEQGACVVEDAP